MHWPWNQGHLDAEGLVDAADNCESVREANHLDRCARCRDAVAMIVATRATAATDRVPEPSPFFWDELSRRVGAAVATDGDHHRNRRPMPGRLGWIVALSAASALVAVAVSLGVWRAPVPPPLAPSRGAFPAAEVREDADEPWGLVMTLAEGFDLDEAAAAGLVPAPGLSERAAVELSSAEREELARLIQEHLSVR